MKIRILLFFFIMPMLVTAQQNSIDVLHYKFELEITDQSDTIYGKATITILPLVKTSQVTLDFESNIRGKGMSVINVTGVNGIQFKSAHLIETLNISLDREYEKSDTINVIVNYKGVPADGLIISKNKFNHRTFFADNWPDRAHQWIPCI